MKNIFKQGDIKTFEKKVLQTDIAQFENGIVHTVYSTFCLARDAEWCSRLFVLEMKENDEEGIGTQLTVQHISPAFINDIVLFTTKFNTITNKGEILTSYTASVNNRIIAQGIQGQKILKKSKLNQLFATLQSNENI